MNLEGFFRDHPRAALGFSGGVDSAYLLYEGLRQGADLRPYYIRTSFQPEFEQRDALRLGRQLGVEIVMIEFDVLQCAAVAANPPDRCYHCKTALFGRLRQQAQLDGYELLLDGTNASDDAGDRPGMRALAELAVRSPLKECGLTKDEIRALSKTAGLFTWNKPAYACLATRIPAHRPITDSLLSRVEAAEDALFALGFGDFRVRVCGEAARLQVKQEQFAKACDARETIVQQLQPYFKTVLLDMEVR